ncbi:hypothetical protein JVU11DRAFT_1650 [Chiua virens]|nr:hypothetical protein JVU11DRAFT_1650 [Chiua virens]
MSLDMHTPRLAPTKPKPRFKKRAVTAGSGEVRDVLNRLGIGKPNGTTNLLKASFPSIQKSDHRCVQFLTFFTWCSSRDLSCGKKFQTHHTLAKSLKIAF